MRVELRASANRLLDSWQYQKICKFCGNCQSAVCIKGVPYYGVSYDCDEFTEETEETVQEAVLVSGNVEVSGKKFNKIMSRVLVETI